MFDDQNLKKPGTIPNNLPFEKEPEDMFSETKEDQNFSSVKDSALDAGILKPKNNDLNQKPNNFENSPFADSNLSGLNNQPAYMNNNDVYAIKEPIGSKKGLVWIILILVLIILTAGSIWIYYGFINNDKTNDFPNNSVTNTKDNLNQEENEVNTNIIVNGSQNENQDNNSEQKTENDVNESIIVGEPVDTDNDGLDDVREYDLKTDPLNWDTDLDELSDGDEVIIWKTNPLNSDSDNDTYKDGSEIKNGYNPLGSGRLFEIQ